MVCEWRENRHNQPDNHCGQDDEPASYPPTHYSILGRSRHRWHRWRRGLEIRFASGGSAHAYEVIPQSRRRRGFESGDEQRHGAGTCGGTKVGDMAPAFSLPGSDGKTHTLAEHKGKRAVVLAWFPKAFTGG